MESLLQLLGSIQPLPPALVTRLPEVMKPRSIKKGDILQQPGEAVAHMYFIHSGLLKAYRFEGKKEVCTWFQHEGNVVMSIRGWYRREEPEEYIEALEDCHVYCITHEELDMLYQQFPEFNYNGRVLTELYYLMVWEWFDLVRTKQAHERYAFFLQHFGDWVRRVPSKDIASFLGISKAHFSYAKRKRK